MEKTTSKPFRWKYLVNKICQLEFTLQVLVSFWHRQAVVRFRVMSYDNLFITCAQMCVQVFNYLNCSVRSQKYPLSSLESFISISLSKIGYTDAV